MSPRGRCRAGACAALCAALALLLPGCGGGDSGGAAVVAAPPPSTPPPAAADLPLADPVAYSTLPRASLATAVESAAITHHEQLVGGVTLRYTATAGHLTARALANGDAHASFFYVAYTLDGRDPATRPVTFFYNGGPGSASVWLHLGSFGPKRLATGVPATTAPTPFALVDNDETLLDTTDLVFVDAVGTGLSEAIAPNTNQTFWGVDADAAVFRDFVRRYLDANGRSASPTFLFGESYGTTRTAVLARLLESAGSALSGIVLQSSVMDYNSNCGITNTGQTSCAGYLPTYGAVGAWYALLDPNPPDLPVFLDGMRGFARDVYAPAVARFLGSGEQPSDSLVADLIARTGASSDLWRTRFNLDPTTYQLRLLGAQMIGRYDARISAPLGSHLASGGDPSNTLVAPSFESAIGAYLAGTLKYSNGSTYVLASSAINAWNFAHDGRQLPDTIPDLAAAMTLNPKLKVLSLNGYHDLATPFRQTELDLARLGSVPQLQVRSYEGGHMTYLDDRSRVLERADLRAFYRSAVAAP